ncbi:MAG TPA: hypothetical protein VMK65_03190 [Longimicrobiales bacterium]|nr:hypothetical protein [Longimicrobiales bacterium]
MSHNGLPALLRLDAMRLSGAVRHPTLSGFVGLALPVLVLVSALWMLAGVGLPATDGAEGGVTLGLLVSGAISFLAYGVLFGTKDQRFLRELGISGRALFVERSARLLGAAMVISLALAIPYLAAGADAARPLAIAAAAGAVTAGVAALAYAGAARAMVSGRSLGLLQHKWDPEMAGTAHLVYAPLLPFLLGAMYGGFAGNSAGAPWLPAFGGLAVAIGLIASAAHRFEPAAPRFLPRAGEMKYAPPPREGGEEFQVGRGLSALLPRRAAAVWVRDAIVAGRRFTWASRVTWPVVIVSGVALARWGSSPSTHAWVVAALGVALLVQSAAVIGLGALERDGRRWIDRLAGTRRYDRFLGRWAWAWGLSLWLLVPVGLAWSWWSGRGPAWSWPVVGALVAAVATSASLIYAERRP